MGALAGIGTASALLRCESGMSADENSRASADPMTKVQSDELRRLSEQAFEPEAFSETLTRAEATLRIGALRAKLRLQDEPPHTL